MDASSGSTPPPASFFGASLDWGGDEFFVGAPGAGNLEGRIYRFARGRNREWSVISKVDTAGLQWGTAYGVSVAANSDFVVAGLPRR